VPNFTGIETDPFKPHKTGPNGNPTLQSLARLITVRGPLSVLIVTNITTETVATVADILRVFTCADKHGLSF
jgi:hypothetical protein